MDKETLLRNMPLFESLAEDELQALMARLEERPFDAGACVFTVGDAGATLFLIQSGEVEISTGQGKTRTVLANLFPGQYFGELSLLDGAPRSATATATKACVLHALDRDDFLSFLASKPGAATKILAEMAERIRSTNDLFSRQVTKNVLEEHEDKMTFGQRVADSVASFGGSWSFIGLFGFVMTAWMALNMWLGEKKAFDPFPFILLNLALSSTAALQAPIIMMSQNRQAAKDKLLAQNDYHVNLKAELGIQTLIKHHAELHARIALLERLLSSKTSSSSNPPTQPPPT